MRLAELSERSGISTATIKYYLREGLLPPGRRISTTQAEYDDPHLRRLRLIRALTQVGRLPVATVREVLSNVDDSSLDQHSRIGSAVWALPHGSQPAPEGQDEQDADLTAQALLEELGWGYSHAAGSASPAYRMLVRAIAALRRLGYPAATENLLPYARAAGQVATTDLELIAGYDDAEEQIEAAVACTVLYEPVLLSLRRLAEAEESNRRFGTKS
ncbi:transcriptional regulator [Streptomyces abyssalis]|uniref:Transcriptional regulator n=1 Tax=Streptomyces abyssalis TaxID=933944 RepID=A0A1E7JHB6_9ACTN|nr:MerR family transcriptional regulator [Streptomyces abyssalis]OEU85842.1 transcriptional regulator [Streptomyces abyssalis]OEU92694.1 transcriptional regulator [Streptomyces abyssalis]